MTEAAADADADAVIVGAQVDALVDCIAPLLAGHSAELQGAVLADLAAFWIAGHRVGPSGQGPGGARAEGDRMRESLLQMYTRHVRELVCMYLEDVDG